LSFHPTPKDRNGRLNPLWLLPQVATLVLLVAGTVVTVALKGHPLSILLTFAIIQGILQLYLIIKWITVDMGRPAWSSIRPKIL